MGERIFYFPFLVDGKIVEEGRSINGLPFERYWAFTRNKMSYEDKIAAHIGDSEMCDLFEPYCNGPSDYRVYDNDEHLHKQLREFASFNSVLREAPYLKADADCREANVDICVIHNDLLRAVEFDHYLSIEGDRTIGIAFQHENDDERHAEQVKELVGEIANDLDGYAWDLFPTRLEKIDPALLACAMVRANGRAQYRRGLSEETAKRIIYGAMVEDVMGYKDSTEESKTYDLIAEGILAISNHLGMNKFFA